LGTNSQSLKQAGHLEAWPRSAIRPTPQTNRRSRLIEHPSEAAAIENDGHGSASAVKRPCDSFTDFTVVSGYVEFFLLLGAGALAGLLWGLVRFLR
jgi:hypothetical protein